MKELIILYYDPAGKRFGNPNRFNIKDLELYKRFKQVSFYHYACNDDNSEIELKKIVEQINLDKLNKVVLITDKKDLYEYFNRKIFVEKYILNVEEFFETNNSLTIVNLNYTDFEYFDINSFIGENDSNILKNITSIFRDYCKIFDLDIELLVKETTYEAKTKEELKQLILEDYQLLKYKHIFTSRLAIVYYRLMFFDLNATSATIGRFFNNFFKIQSSPFKFNLRIPPNKYYFPSLHNKSFRGYKLELPKQPDNEYQLKIKIAKKLLSNNVSIKIVSKSLEIPEEKLKHDIYFFDNKDISKNEKFDQYSDIKTNNMKKYNDDIKKSFSLTETINSNHIIENFKNS